MATLLLELFSEEIPSRMQRGAAEQLQRLVLAGFEKNMLKPSDVKTFVSPRHLAIQCFGLPEVQPDVKEEKRGPKIGAPEQAMKGFLAASGLTVEQCEQRDGYYYARLERKGRAVAEVVKEVCEHALTAFGWPKSMRWGSRPLNWVRPLHRITCLLDEKIVPTQFAHLTASNITHGHRFLSPAEIIIPHAEKYEALLKDAKVVVDYAARRAQIKTEITALAKSANVSVVEDEALLDEVTGLVEWPVPLLGVFDKKFLGLPPEVLISEMKVHQRYFALADSNGNLTNQFIAVANMVTADGGKRVIAGNARVLRARLSDGEFYWEQDRKTSLEDWGKKLSDVVFHAKVGMMNEKVARIEALAVAIAKAVDFTDEKSVRRAAQLCKADLTSGMVGEFPDLQGIMGRYYATAQGESQEIADAIRDHYKPVGAGDSVPESKLAAIIAIADKLDSITSLFAAGEKPTGSKDPLALRRAALGVLRILDQKNWAFDLGTLIFVSLVEFLEQQTEAEIKLILNQANQAQSILPNSKDLEDLHKQLESAKASKITASLFTDNPEIFIGLIKPVAEFFKDRIFNMLRDEGLNREILDAVAVVHGLNLNTVSIAVNARRLDAWLTTDAGKTTLTAIKRAIKMLADEEKKAKQTFTAGLSDKLTSPAEKALVAALKLAPKMPSDLDALAAPIQQFFTDHMVNDENPAIRDARLSLLAAVRDAANQIADFSKIEG